MTRSGHRIYGAETRTRLKHQNIQVARLFWWLRGEIRGFSSGNEGHHRNSPQERRNNRDYRRVQITTLMITIRPTPDGRGAGKGQEPIGTQQTQVPPLPRPPD